MGRSKNITDRKRMSQILGDDIEQEARDKKRTINEDAMQRRAIQDDIIKMIKSGKGKIETLDYLWNKYKDVKYCMYISQWYQYHYAKLKTEKSKSIEGR